MHSTSRQRRLTVVALSTLAVAVSATACSSGSGSSGSKDAAGGTYTVWDPYPQFAKGSDWAKLLDQCGTKAGVKIKRTAFDTSDLATKTLLAAQQGNSPDVLIVDNPVVSTLAEAGVLTTTDDNKLDTSKTDANLLAAGQSGGKTYGIPIGANTLALFYNKEVLKKAGVDISSVKDVTGPTLLARRLVAAGTRVVLLSTSAVFDWRVPHVQASRLPCPVTVYGKLKAEAEKAFLAFGAAASILRLTKVLMPTDGLFNSWIDALSRKQPVTAFSDHHMAPVTLSDAVSALLAISASSESGVFQVSGAHDISYYDAALHLVSRLGVNPRLVVKAQASESRTPADEIIQFSSMDTSRICALTGWKAPDAYSVIDEVFRERFGAVRAGSSAGRP